MITASEADCHTAAKDSSLETTYHGVNKETSRSQFETRTGERDLDCWHILQKDDAMAECLNVRGRASCHAGNMCAAWLADSCPNRAES